MKALRAWWARRTLRVRITLTVGVVALLAASPAGAEVGSRQSFAGTFSSEAPGSSTGYGLAIDYRNPRDSGGKPWGATT